MHLFLGMLMGFCNVLGKIGRVACCRREGRQDLVAGRLDYKEISQCLFYHLTLDVVQ